MKTFIAAFLFLSIPLFAQEKIPLTPTQTDSVISALKTYNEAKQQLTVAQEKFEKAMLILDNRILTVYVEKGVRREEYQFDETLQNLVKKVK